VGGPRSGQSRAALGSAQLNLTLFFVFTFVLEDGRSGDEFSRIRLAGARRETAASESVVECSLPLTLDSTVSQVDLLEL